MRKSLFLAVFTALLIICLAGCRTARQSATQTPPVVLTERDSVRTEYVETVRIDTVRVTVTVPAESSSVVVCDSTSHLETTVAESDAWINPDGTLGHTLANKGQALGADVLVPVKDTATATTSAGVREIPVPYPQPFEVEREITAWERFRLSAFWPLASACLLAALWIFRTPLLSLVDLMRKM